MTPTELCADCPQHFAYPCRAWKANGGVYCRRGWQRGDPTTGLPTAPPWRPRAAETVVKR